MKFKGVSHPLIISPARVVELFEVTQTPEGGSALVQMLWVMKSPDKLTFLFVNTLACLQAFGWERAAVCPS